MSIHEEVKKKAINSLKWSILVEIVNRTATPVIFIILARLLTPADFGIMATAMIAISFSQIFWDAGLSKALVQTREAPEDAAHIVFWTNIFLGVLIYFILFASAPAVALFFNSPASEPVLRVLGCQIVIASFSSVQQALFVRDLNFRILFWIKLVTAFVPVLCSIPLALSGYGVWALVIGSLAGQIINCLLLWRLSAWRPKFIYNKSLADKLFAFGFWVVGEGITIWLVLWGDNLIVGKFLGIHDLGVYRTGWMMVNFVFGIVLSPFIPVLYPTLSRLQDNIPAMIKIFLKVNRVIMALVLPIGVGLFLVGSDAAFVFFGNKWQGLGLVLSVIGLTNGITWTVGINTELYRSFGRPDVNTKLMFVAALYYLPSYYIAASFGLEIFVYARLIVGTLGILIHVYVCKKLFNISPFYLWHEGKNIIFSTAAMAFSVIIIKWGIMPVVHIPHIFISIMIIAGAGCLTYLGCLWYLDRPFILETRNLLKKVAFN
ncbi:MAG: lipopolysaccharide biosynthesis protein [bacterium]|nr:lipopolysaccharide biosynthesis protein [bacterium]